MKHFQKICIGLFAVAMAFILTACATTPTVKTSKVPMSSDSMLGENYEYVVSKLEKAGFTNITLESIADLTSGSIEEDGKIESVTIDGSSSFNEKDPFPRDTNIVITYHLLPKIEAPISSEAVLNGDYADAAQSFKNAGFENVTSTVTYDLDPDEVSSDHINVVTVNGKEASFEEGEGLPFDAEIAIECHYPFEKYTVTVHVDFHGNLIFNKYDVAFYVDGTLEDTIDHGDDMDYTLRLQEGEHTLTFAKYNDSSIDGKIRLDVSCDIEAEYSISCDDDHVSVAEGYVDYLREIADNEVKVSGTVSEYKYEDYQEVIAELKELGFKNIITDPQYDIIWGITPTGEVSNVTIDGSDDYRRGDVYDENVEVIVSYHMPYKDDPANAEDSETTAMPQSTAETTTPEPTETVQQTSEPQVEEAKESIYDYAFVRAGSEYSIYYLFDMDTGVARYFLSNDTGVLVGTFTGDLSSGLTITYDDHGTVWTETFAYKSGSTTDAVMIDNDGFSNNYKATSVATAEAVLNQPGYEDINPIEDDSTIIAETPVPEEPVETSNVAVDENGDTETVDDSEGFIKASGTIGETITWSYWEDQGTVVISGTGDLKDYTEDTSAPWIKYSNGIYIVEIEDGVTSIGEYEFAGCENLYMLVVPDSVTRIGSYAFNNCTNLQNIIVGTGLESINEGAFEGCTNLWNFCYAGTIDSFMSIDIAGNNPELMSATICCESSRAEMVDNMQAGEILTSKTVCLSDLNAAASEEEELTNLPASDTDAIDNEISVSEKATGSEEPIAEASSEIADTPETPTVEGIVWDYDSDKKALLISGSGDMDNYSVDTEEPWYEFIGEIETISIDDGVTSIGEGAFRNCNSAVSVDVAESVTSIGADAFRGCAAMEKIYVPVSVLYIGGYAFDGCAVLSDIYYEGTETDYAAMNIEYGSGEFTRANFHYCAVHSDVTGESETYSEAKSDMAEAAPDETQIEELTIISGDAGTLTWTYDKDSGELIVAGSGNMESYESADEEPWFDYIDEITSISVEDGVTSIGDCAFRNCSETVDVYLAESVTSIGEDAFRGCSSLRYIYVPTTVTYIGGYVFDGCATLTYIFYAGTENDYAAMNIEYGSGEFTRAYFYYNASVDETEETIASETETSTATTDGTDPEWKFTEEIGLLTISSDCNMPDYASFDDVPWADYNDQIIYIIVEYGVTRIGDRAFGGCVNLEKVFIPSSVTSIGNYVLTHCSNLNGIYFGGSTTAWSRLSCGQNFRLNSMTPSCGLTNEQLVRIGTFPKEPVVPTATPSPTPTPTPIPTSTPTPVTATNMVWIPNSGSKYHSTSTCSNMKNPTQVTQAQAEAMGYTRCSKCW